MKLFFLLLIFTVCTAVAAPNPWSTLDDTLKAGRQAGALVRDTLKGPFTVVTRKATAAGRGKELRYYAMVQVGGRNLDEILVLQGLARAKGVAASVPGEKSRAHVQRLRLLEEEAKQKGRGLWARKK